MLRKKDIMGFINSDNYKPSTEIELYNAMGLEDVSMSHFCNCLRELTEENKLVYTKKNRIMTPLSLGRYIGTLDTTRKGFGFVKSLDGSFKDVYISKENINGASHGDVVLAYLIEHKPKYWENPDREKRTEGRIEEILEYKTQRVVGTLDVHGSYGFVKPDDVKHSISDIFVSCGKFNGAQHNDKVVCEIIRNSVKDNKPEGNIVKVICNKDDRFADILSVIEHYELPEVFPDKVLKEAEYFGDRVKEEEIEGRVDLRDELIFTIDGPYAKDLDDAISIKRLDNGNIELGVHIADVTHYVKEKSKLDKEALKRGTSVYLVDKVIPMLPPKLSNGLCSLHPYTDKLTLSIIMEIDNQGHVLKHEIVESVINSKHRLTYGEVTDLLVNSRASSLLGANPTNLPPKLADSLFLAETLALILRRKRMKKGALDLDLPEADIVLDSDGEVVDIGIEPRSISNIIIEEFMLIANETVAEQFVWLDLPFVYRVHEIPDGEKVGDFSKMIETFGYHIKGDFDNMHPKTLQKLITKLKGKDECAAICNYMLRSFKHARYSPDSLGHFGLSSNFYTHFTSPIRRYPDLQIHRIIKMYLHGKLKGRKIEEMTNTVEWSSKRSSDREILAEKAERDVVKVYTAKLMERFIGEEFEGRIMSLTKIGMFVQIKGIIEGMVRIDSIPGDTFGYDEQSYIVKGVNTDKTFKLGQYIKIKVSNVDTLLHEITFEIVE